ncbi:MAG: NAD(+)/NADH kinase [Deltaproteobacteria bacterium]|nr:NAD(+)/NADH kinase [Deltaproteobacteria bacterium]
MNTVGIFTKPSHAQAEVLASRCVAWFAQQGIRVLALKETAAAIGAQSCTPEQLREEIQLAVVFGGDGTLIAAARQLEARPIPILGVNLGRLGFMAEVSPENIFPILKKVISGDFTISERMALSATVWRAGQEIARVRALNDIVITKGALARIIDIETRIDDVPATFRADGLIVATPTGSTAYNLAAGGPIVSPELRCLIVTPICPHTLTNRPLIVPEQEVIHVTVRHDEQNVVYATADGQVGVPLKNRDEVEIRSTHPGVPLIRGQEYSYFEVLRRKLHWGI